MSVITTLDITDMTPQEYRAVLDRMGVETRPAAGIYLHLTTTMSFGFRIVELLGPKGGLRAVSREAAGARDAGARHRAGDRDHRDPAAQSLRSSAR